MSVGWGGERAIYAPDLDRISVPARRGTSTALEVALPSGSPSPLLRYTEFALV